MNKNNISALFPVIAPELRRKMLAVPQGKVKAVMDTDTFNEMDDQFALSMALLLPEYFDLQAVIAAPFLNSRAKSPADGMEQSYQEILHVFDCLDIKRENFVFRGSDRFMEGTVAPVESEGARRIVELAEEAARNGETLYILAIGAITNVASALLMKPEIIRNITVVWLGGHDLYTVKNNEFNLKQDVAAAQVIFDSGVPLVWIPCCGVAELLVTTLGEIEQNLTSRVKSRIGRFLQALSQKYLNNIALKQKVLWDISAVLYFTRPDLYNSRLIPAPVLEDDMSWTEDPARHEIRKITYFEHFGCLSYMYDTLAKAPE